MKFSKLILTGLAICSSVIFAQAEIRINEIMQSNVHGITDDLNELPDSWVELYNNGDATILLSDYGLSVKDKASKAYTLPQISLTPGQYVVIYCDKVESGLHTDFRVDSGESDLFLWKGSEKIETVHLAAMPAPDIAFGRLNETSDTWGYQALPTPGAPNCGTMTESILPAPIFSTSGGVMTSPVSLSLSMPEATPDGAVIRYTTDGSAPTVQSDFYTQPFEIVETTVIRAAIFLDGYLSPLPTTQSYIFHPREQSLPIVSIATSPEYLYDEKMGILVEGTYSEDKENFQFDWRRPMNIEYFDVDGKPVINQVGETRVKGGVTRDFPVKSLVLYANKRFGTKKFAYEFFPEDAPGIKKFKSLELRNAGNDFYGCFMRDALMQRVVGKNTCIDWQPAQTVIVYLNGKYNGLLNLRTRSNEDYVEAFYDGLEDIHMFENWWELKAGDMEAFNDFKKFYQSEQSTLEEYRERMDVAEFADLFISNIIFDNRDFPANNVVMWRPEADGGKWRWIAKDMDGGMNRKQEWISYRTLDWMIDNNFDPSANWGNALYGTQLYISLLRFPEFRDMLIDRASIYLGDFLRPEIVNSHIDYFADAMTDELPYHRALYPSYLNYDEEISTLRNWQAQRIPFFYSHLAEHFDLNAPIKMKINNSDTPNIDVTVNGIKLATGTFDGMWNPGREISIKATRPDGMQPVDAWRVTVSKNGSEAEMIYPTEEFQQVIPAVDYISIEPIIGYSGVNDIEMTPAHETTVEWFDLQGRSLGSQRPVPGIYIRKAGNKFSKTVVTGL